MLKNFFLYNDLSDILWYCNIIAIVLGAGLILKNNKAVTLAFVTTIPAQLLWMIDFFFELLGEGMGRTAHIFNNPLWAIILTTNLHLVLIPIATYGVYKLGFAENILPHLILFIVALLSISYFFTDIEVNINCVFYSCDATEPPLGEDKVDYAGYFIFRSLLFWNLIGVIIYYAMIYLIRVKKN